MTAEITADDIKALRIADAITFHYNKGESTLRAHLRGGYAGEPRIFTATQQRLFPQTDRGDNDRTHVITPDASVYSYADDQDETPQYGFVMIHHADMTDEWKTIVGLLRAGDSLHLSWIADNNNDVHRENNLHTDELRLVITRGQRKLTFVIETQTSYDSSARMIRRFA